MKILVTGCKGGIGKCLCRHYSENGNNVRGISRSDVDILNWEEMRSYFSDDSIKGLDMVVHCAAKNTVKRFEKMSYSSFKEIIDCNVLGTFNLLKCAIPLVVPGGSIILFSSSAAFSPRIGQAAYAASKAALHGLVKVLAQELLVVEKYLFVIAPGLVEKGMPQKLMTEKMLVAATERIPMRRTCTMAEIIRTIDYLKMTPYLTGQTIHLNGGYYLV